MKRLSPFQKYMHCIALLLLSSAFNIISAQSKGIPNYQQHKQAKSSTTYKTKVSFILLGVGIMSTGNHSGTLNVSLPYQTMDINGVKIAHVFNGTSTQLFPKQSPEIQFGLDVVRPTYALNFSFGFNTMYSGAFYSLGYGINLYLGHQGRALLEKTRNCNWMIRPSLNINFFNFSTGTIGSITNTNTTIYILGTETKPTYTYNTHSNHSSYRHTAQADNLLISYKQNQLGLEPKIAFCTNPYKKRYSIQIFTSYFIPIFESSGLLFKQSSYSTSSTNPLSGSSENSLKHHNEIHATYNNQAFNTVPFHANYFCLGVVVSFLLGK